MSTAPAPTNGPTGGNASGSAPANGPTEPVLDDHQGEPGGPDDDADGQGDDADPEGADQLGDAGKKALDAQKAKWKAERDRRKEIERQLAEATKPKDTDGEPTPEQIRADAEKAATARANRRIVRAEVKAAAAGKFADPGDALAFLDLDQFEVDADGELDPDEVSEAITELLTRKPHLAAGPAKRFQGGGDGGAGRGAKPKGLDEQIREAEKAGNIGLSLRLKQQKLAEARKKNSQ
ncbi:hypothetical protein NE857_31565 [Nocardiopsis exhalans]|uniref:EF-hand domain-containing protein n=2 Tax=Nocardiopsis exhalans TaxID=163604 RepID=A0ABY5D908_9ACTN|nr:hypothetical protein [Nocardiopsis exhalans]USY19718.1 hypothetical protein NE857_31565 [Nocardiopsis exhalans]